MPVKSVCATALLLLLALVGCRSAQGPDPVRVRAIIEEKNQLLERLYAEGEIDAAAEHFATDAWQMVPNAPPLVGRDAYRQFWSQAAGWGTWSFDLVTRDVVVEDGIAVERGNYTLALDAGPESPVPGFTDRGNYVVLWRLEPDGEWRVVWDAPVSELPAAE